MKSFSPSLAGTKNPWRVGHLTGDRSNYRRRPQVPRLEPHAPERGGSDRRHRGCRDRVRGGGCAQLRPARRRRRARQRAAAVHARPDQSRRTRAARHLGGGHLGGRLSPDSRQLRFAIGCRFPWACGCSRSSSTISSSSPIRPIISSMPRSAAAASIRTGSTRSNRSCEPVLDVMRGGADPGDARRHRRDRARQSSRRPPAIVSRPPRHRGRRRGRQRR